MKLVRYRKPKTIAVTNGTLTLNGNNAIKSYKKKMQYNFYIL